MQTSNIRRNTHYTTRRTTRGFTMVEILITLSMAGVLSSVALPTVQGHLQKARRADVLVSMMQVQLAQSRWRANGTSYGTLAPTTRSIMWRHAVSPACAPLAEASTS